jgi:hypothetical protein
MAEILEENRIRQAGSYVQVGNRRAIRYVQQSMEEREAVTTNGWIFAEGQVFLICSHALPTESITSSVVQEESRTVNRILESIRFRA